MPDSMLLRRMIQGRIHGTGRRQVADRRTPGGGFGFLRAVSHTYGLLKTDHANKGGFLNRSTRDLFVNYMQEKGVRYGR